MKRPIRVISLCIFGLIHFAAGPETQAQPPAAKSSPPKASTVRKLTLLEAEQRSLSSSARVASAKADVHSADEMAKAQGAARLPKLSIEGMGKYVSEVPTMKPAFGPPMPLGDNNNYSIGPALSYTLWDGGAQRHSFKSAQRLAEAKTDERITAEANVLLSTRVAYAQAQLAEQELKLVMESLELAHNQSRDIDSRLRAGSASRLDSLNAKTDVSNFELRRAQSQAELSAAWAELAAWVGLEQPSSTEMASLGPETIVLDDLEQSAKTAELAKVGNGVSQHPQVRAQEKLAESSDLAADAQAAQYWPMITAQLKASLDYPNGSNLEQVQQKTAMVNLSWSLFEWGKTSASVEQKRADALAARYRRNQVETDLHRDWVKAMARFESLVKQLDTASLNVRQSEEISRLKYDTYKAGRTTYLEVQSANLKSLESKVAKARIEAQMLAQFHTLRFLSVREAK